MLSGGAFSFCDDVPDALMHCCLIQPHPQSTCTSPDCSSADAINDHAAARVFEAPPPTAGPAERRPRASTGAKRNAAAAELAEEAELEEAEAELAAELAAEARLPMPDGTVPMRRSSRATRGARLNELLAAEQEEAGELAAPATRALPQRTSALRSPAGQRRKRPCMLDQLAAMAAAEEVENAAAQGAVAAAAAESAGAAAEGAAAGEEQLAAGAGGPNCLDEWA